MVTVRIFAPRSLRRRKAPERSGIRCFRGGAWEPPKPPRVPHRPPGSTRCVDPSFAIETTPFPNRSAHERARPGGQRSSTSAPNSRLDPLRPQDRRRDFEPLTRLRGVVGPDDPRSRRPGRDRGDDRAGDAIDRIRLAGHCADEALAARPHEHRASKRHEFSQPRDQREVLLDALAEAKARIDRDRRRIDARRLRDRDARESAACTSPETSRYSGALA